MKNLFFAAIFSVSFSMSLKAQLKNDELYYFIKVWGLLKYYHPAIQKGMVDWDQAFIRGINSVLQDKAGGLSPIDRLIEISGKEQIPSSSPGSFEQYKNAPYSNLDFDWIQQKGFLLPQQDKDWLKRVVENYKTASNTYIGREINKYYLNTPLEKFWYRSDYLPDSAHSLLALARYWNIINYFDPHKKLFDQDWDKTLKEFIPVVLKNASKKEIYLTFASLAVKIDDSHAFYNNYEFDSLMGLHRPALVTSLYENKYNVVTYISDGLQKLTAISKGDIITKLNNKEIARVRDEIKVYCKASTDRSTQRNIDAVLFKGNIDQRYDLEFTNSNNQVKTATFTFTKDLIFQYNGRNFENTVTEYPAQKAFYVRFPATKGQLKTALKKAGQAGGYLVLDLRAASPAINWNWLTGQFITKRVQVAKYYKCSFTYPGYFKPQDVYKKPGFSLFSKKYTGKLIVLINEKVQSSLEFNLMILKAAYPDIIFIGRNTAGADGSATSVLIQDNVLTYFTRDVVLFPDGKQTQRIGIVPDIYVEDSVELFRQGKDAILEKTLQFITQQRK